MGRQSRIEVQGREKYWEMRNDKIGDKISVLSLIVCSLVHSVESDSLSPHGLQPARLPIHHQLAELAQTHIHQVSNAIQPSHPLLSS